MAIRDILVYGSVNWSTYSYFLGYLLFSVLRFIFMVIIFFSTAAIP